MLRSPMVLFALLCTLALEAGQAAALDSRMPTEADPAPRAARFGPATSATLGEWDFGGTGEAPDPQGWTGVDVWSQTSSFWHVDDFAGLAPPYAPLQGTQSLWCGVRTGAAEYCIGGNFPGYGNDWIQDFSSIELPVTGPGDVTVSYQIAHDMEDGYDFLYLQFLGAGGSWQEARSYTGTASAFVDSVVIPDAAVDATLRLRFVFVSDNAWSDEDDGNGFDTNGAAILDELSVVGPGLNLSEDFEDEPVNATGTSDGTWLTQQLVTFGNYTGVADASSILQEDPVTANTTGVWTFFEGSAETCADFGAQTIVPSHDPAQLSVRYNYIYNEVRSPVVDLAASVDGSPVPPTPDVRISFDVYRDNELDRGLFYGVRTRFLVGGCWTSWDDGGTAYGSTTPEWIRQTVDRTIPPGATHVQVGLTCQDLCFAGVCATEKCHGHAPLFDNVRVERAVVPIMVTSAADAGAGTLRDAILQANVSPDTDLILFDIPGTSSIIQLGTPLPESLWPLAIDATSDPDFDPVARVPVVELDGSLLGGLTPGILLTDSMTIRGLAIHGFPGDGVQIVGSETTVQGCAIGYSPGGFSFPGNGNYGVFVTGGATNSRIGGPGPGEGNHVVGHPLRGIVVEDSDNTGHSIRGNQLSGNGLIEIDLNEDLTTSNDPGDLDAGANGSQNFPTITFFEHFGRIEGELSSRPDTAYEIDLYATDVCAPTGYGGAQEYLGAVSVQTDGTGFVRFAYEADPLQIRNYLTATATDPDGNTSEFSACYAVPDWIVASNTNDSGGGSLRAAIEYANNNPDPTQILILLGESDPGVFAPLTPLPAITAPTSITGYAMEGATPNQNDAGLGIDATLRAVLSGENLVAGDGLQILADDCWVRGLSIVGFPGNGILLEGNNNRITGCSIGVWPDGVTADGNGAAGIRVNDIGLTSTATWIGDAYPEHRNLISANGAYGIAVLGRGVRILGNLIGTDSSGLNPMGNERGIEINGGFATEAVIGGATLAERNVIAASTQFGIQLSGDFGSVNNNLIGVGIDGATPMGNGTFGVFLSAVNGLVGTAAGNVIAHNGFDGVRLFSGSGHRVWNNSIHSNGQLGIDVEADGVTSIPSTFALIPIIHGVDVALDEITYEVSAEAFTNMKVQFFSSSSCDPSGYGEGQTLLGETAIQTSSDGDVTSTWVSPVPLQSGDFITAVAEHPTRRASEFSACFEALNTPAGSSVAVDLGGVDLTFDAVSVGGTTGATASSSGPALPTGFTVGGSSVYWDLTTTATFTDSVEVCLDYDPVDLGGDESSYVLLHYDELLDPDAWVDITSSRDPANDRICGRTGHLSPFVVARPEGQTGTAPLAPLTARLRTPAPNPFNPRTMISFDVPASGERVRLRIYDARGRFVRGLVDRRYDAGTWSEPWDGLDGTGRPVASGVYFVRMEAGAYAATRSMVLLK